MATSERAQVMVTVKAYPQLSKKSGEVVCVAGVRLDTEGPEWIRLYPVAYRDLDEYQKFKKYDIIDVEIRRGNDARPESFIPAPGSISVVRSIDSGSDQRWTERRRQLGSLVAETTMCRLLRQNEKSGRAVVPSLGLIKPDVLEVEVERNGGFDADKRALAAISAEATLFTEAKQELEPSPYIVKYRYRCAEPGCRAHTQSLIDWEVGEAGRRWSRRYPEAEIPDRIREKFLTQLCGADRDTHFFVGNTHQWLTTFLVLGVFWPKVDVDDPLF
ncbi:MAG: hypothetical protein QM714_13665 [Nocardioides sp.]|uniref:hypothetical protein n=1 Tax=Nocardioides sp. TaxID=35761 RepID=UPI0039E25D26